MLAHGWGRYPSIDAKSFTFNSEVELRARLETISSGSAIARGLGRSYGDSSLSENLLSTGRFNRFISFDGATGELVCESGVSLSEILDVFVPRGWFLPVTPGTRFVTVGGAIASDVHGKNHHNAGSLSNHVSWMDILLADGDVARCSKSERGELFLATCAGYGLTGVILRASVRLQRVETAYIRERTIRTKNLDEVLDAFDEQAGWTYSVGWIDCLARGKNLGRSVLMLGEHATRADIKESMEALRPGPVRELAVPFEFPGFFLNTFTVRAFNVAYYGKASSRERIIRYEPFFYPLDGVHNWSRIYGKRGFVQYQLVLPKESGKEGLKKILRVTASKGLGSFLAVLKLFGKEDGPYLSFAKEGYTLALDFPITSSIFVELDELDSIVKGYGGRLYPTKDSRMKKEMFLAGYPRRDKFMEIRSTVDPHRRFESLQSRRLGI